MCYNCANIKSIYIYDIVFHYVTCDFCSDLPNEGSRLLNVSEAYPKVSMHIIDLTDHSKINDVALGQNLELQIVLDPPNSVYDIRAVQLIAKTDTGHNSILLLDNNGCPTDLTVFPAFDKIATKTSHLLSAKFHAFKFAGSSFVNFDVKIQFCLYECMPINCGRNVWSHGRRKRSEPSYPNSFENSQQNIVVSRQSPSPYLTPPNPNQSQDNRFLYSAYEQQKNVKNAENSGFRQIRVEPNNIVMQRVLSNSVSRSNESAATVMQTSRQNFTDPRRVLKNIDDVPLQVQLNVRAPAMAESSDSLIYSESSHSLLAGIGKYLFFQECYIRQILSF